jgi:hypothetical protein
MTLLLAATIGTTLMKLSTPTGYIHFSTTVESSQSDTCQNWIGFTYQFVGKTEDWPEADTVMMFFVDGKGHVVSSQGTYSQLGSTTSDAGWTLFNSQTMRSRWLTAVMIDTQGYQPDNLESAQQVFDWAQKHGRFVAEDYVDVSTLESSCAALTDTGPYLFS